MDEDLRALRRRWEESQTEEDLERYLQAEARATGREARWIRHTLTLAAFAPERVEEAATAFLRAACAGQPRSAERPGYRSELYTGYQALIRAQAGPWFSGLEEEWAPAWCPCHWLPKGPDEIDRCVEQTLAQLRSVHGYEQALVTLAETHLEVAAEGFEQESDAFEQAQLIGEVVIDLLIEATGCNDAWYHKLAGALGHVAWGLGAEFESEALELLIETRFSSWVEPAPEARAEVQSAFAQALIDAGYGARP